MTTCFDDEQDRMQDIASNSLWGDENNPLHPEYEGDYGVMEHEEQALRESILNPWDRLLTPKERREIAECNVEIYETCPYLQKARGSERFYFCQALADGYPRDGNNCKTLQVKFSGAIANVNSAEFYSHCLPDELRAHCVGDCFTDCEVFQINDPDFKIPFSK